MQQAAQTQIHLQQRADDFYAVAQAKEFMKVRPPQVCVNKDHALRCLSQGDAEIGRRAGRFALLRRRTGDQQRIQTYPPPLGYNRFVRSTL